MFKHLHIVACSPRSGTTLLHEVMVTCFEVDKHHDHEVRFHLASAEDEQLLITKRPKDTMYMPLVLTDDPELYVIYLQRDPRDVICSRHGKNKRLYYANIRLYQQMHDYAKEIDTHERFLKVRYEDFVRNPDAVQELIVKKFPWLVKKHLFSDYHQHADVSEKSAMAMHNVRPIAPTSIGTWKKHLARIKGQQMIHGSLTPLLIECGYETSDDWEQILDSVAPDLSRSHYPEKLYFWSRISQKMNGWRKAGIYRRKRGYKSS